MNAFREYVSAFDGLLKTAPSPQTVFSAADGIKKGPAVLLFSPHPDDECVTGLFPLRLMREAGMQIVNVPVTFGSNPERQAARAAELKNACDCLGFQCLDENSLPPRRGFQSLGKNDIVELLKTIRPRIVFMPHSGDWNSRHIETHHLVMDALKEMPDDFSCYVVETEFWGAMSDPNLMVEGDASTVADLVAALSLHTGEVERNPYHLMLPAWMIDNVRRGTEIVLGQGGRTPDVTFATLYRLSRWKDGRLVRALEKGRTLRMHEKLTEIG